MNFLLRDEYLAYKAALFFCINPASVLFVAPMTSTILSAASFAALASVESGMGLFTGVYLAMATAAHHNGILNLLMVLYSSMKMVATQTILYIKHKKKIATTRSTGTNNRDSNNDNSTEKMISAFTNIGISAMMPGIWCIISAVAPFAAYQWFGFAAFCKLNRHEMGTLAEDIVDYGLRYNLSMPGQDEKPQWCFQEPPIPFMHLGGIADFKEPFSHWVPEEWPHYIAWGPSVVLVLWQAGQFFKFHKRFCMRLGLVDNTLLGLQRPKTLAWTLTKALPRDALIYLLQAILIIFSTTIFCSFQVRILANFYLFFLGTSEQL